MENVSPNQTVQEPNIATAPQSVPVPQAVIPDSAQQVSFSQPIKSKLPMVILVSATALIVVAGLVYGAYWYQSEGKLSQNQSVENSEEQAPNIEPEVEYAQTETLDKTQVANSIAGEAQVGYAVENQFGGYFLMISIDATSADSDIAEVSVWADEDEVQQWEPFAGDVGMTINLATKKKSDVYVQFRDSEGNASEKITITQQMIEAVRQDI